MNIKASSQFGMSKKYTNSPAFTIVELLVVIVVIGILAAITIVSYNGITQKAAVASVTSNLDNASRLLKLDQTTNGIYPATLAEANGGKGIPTNPDITYTYIANNNLSSPSFCITATKGSTTYKITSDATPAPGDCNDFGLVISLDTGNSSSYPGSGTAWTDLSGFGNNGTLVNGVNYSGTNGGIFNFDGTDDYVTVPNGVNLIQKSGAFSIGLFFKMNSLASLRGLMGTLNYGCALNLGLVANNNSLSVYNDTGTCYSVDLPGWVEINKWLFAVATYDGSITKLYGIKDGVLASSSGSSKSGLTNSFNSTFKIMGNQNSSNFTNGSCSYAFAFNRVLTQSEILDKYNSSKTRLGL